MDPEPGQPSLSFSFFLLVTLSCIESHQHQPLQEAKGGLVAVWAFSECSLQDRKTMQPLLVPEAHPSSLYASFLGTLGTSPDVSSLYHSSCFLPSQNSPWLFSLPQRNMTQCPVLGGTLSPSDTISTPSARHYYQCWAGKARHGAAWSTAWKNGKKTTRGPSY